MESWSDSRTSTPEPRLPNLDSRTSTPRSTGSLLRIGAGSCERIVPGLQRNPGACPETFPPRHGPPRPAPPGCIPAFRFVSRRKKRQLPRIMLFGYYWLMKPFFEIDDDRLHRVQEHGERSGGPGGDRFDGPRDGRGRAPPYPRGRSASSRRERPRDRGFVAGTNRLRRRVPGPPRAPERDRSGAVRIGQSRSSSAMTGRVGAGVSRRLQARAASIRPQDAP